MRKIKSELAGFIRANKKKIIEVWSRRIFEVPGHSRVKDVITKDVHIKGMKKYLNAFITDVERPSCHACNAALRKLILHDYLSASSSEDTIHGQIILRDVITDLLLRTCNKDPEHLSALSHALMTTIEHAIKCILRIYKKREFDKLKTIMRYGKKLIAVHDLDRLCKLIIEAAVKECDCDRASIMLVDKDNYLKMKYSVGITRRIATGTKQKVGEGIAGKVAKTATPIIINTGHGQRVAHSMKKKLRGQGLTSAIVLPLIADTKVVGVLNLGKYKNKPFFDEEDVELLVILGYEAGAAISNCYLFEEVHELYVGSIVSLAAAIDARDHYTHGHSKVVSRLATATAQRLGLSKEAIERVYFASMLHDIGKIGVPDNILRKEGKLDEKEWAIIKKHPIYAARILKHIPRMKSIVPIVYHEHERYDGKGYVEGLKGEQIPIESRIIAIADAYEAMTSKRPYRKPLPRKVVINELKKNAGTQFDPKVVKVFLQIIK